jgi:hypothetical protein
MTILTRLGEVEGYDVVGIRICAREIASPTTRRDDMAARIRQHRHLCFVDAPQLVLRREQYFAPEVTNGSCRANK